ncbi:MAG: hypothetical protein GEV10_15075 [Streptosporangiales bacterium]|nr:hypothetical protein [Streptosporangiales bacterium]
MRGRVGIVAVLATCAVVASSCGLAAKEATQTRGPRETPNPVVSTEYAASVQSGDVRLLGSRRSLGKPTGLVIGPHFVLHQQSVGTVREVSAGVARKLGIPGPVRAPAGHEFVVADFAKNVAVEHDLPRGGRQIGSLQGKKYRQWLSVGRSARPPIYVDVTKGTLLIVCAPEGEPVRLKILDSGRTQWLDLRTGKRGQDAVTSFYPSRDWSPALPDGEVTTVGVAGGEGVVTTVRDVTVSLRPFGPNGTWARRGKAWLYVTVDAATLCGASVASCHVTLAPNRQIRVRVGRAGRLRTVGKVTTQPLGVGTSSTSSSTVAFEVPQTIRSAKLTLSTAGRVSMRPRKPKSKVARPSWFRRPAPLTARLVPRG